MTSPGDMRSRRMRRRLFAAVLAGGVGVAAPALVSASVPITSPTWPAPTGFVRGSPAAVVGALLHGGWGRLAQARS